MANLPQKPLDYQGQFVTVFHGEINQTTEIFKKGIDKYRFLLDNNRKGARNTITNSVIATPSGFLLSILSVMGKMNLSVKTVARLFACYEHLVHPFFVKGKISQTGVLANV